MGATGLGAPARREFEVRKSRAAIGSPSTTGATSRGGQQLARLTSLDQLERLA
jgi:hypothetical protein